MMIEHKGAWARLLAEAASCYWTAQEWAELPADRQALELAKMDNADVWTQAAIVGQAEQARPWAVILDWTARGILTPLVERRAA
jgi:hypothetical protein